MPAGYGRRYGKGRATRKKIVDFARWDTDLGARCLAAVIRRELDTEHGQAGLKLLAEFLRTVRDWDMTQTQFKRYGGYAL